MARAAAPGPRAPSANAFRDRVVELRRVRAGDLRENPKNWRRHPTAQRRALRGLLSEIGFADALLATEDRQGLMLVDGHLRRSIHPDQVIPVLVLDLAPEEADKLLATLDPLAGLAEPDPDRVAELLAGVQTASAAVRDLLQGLAARAGLPALVGLTDPDAVPAPPKSPRTRTGDLWLLGPHRLLCGDATNHDAVREVMKGEWADCLWTDPPYGVDYRGKTSAALRIRGDLPGELEGLLAEAFAAIDHVLRPGAALYVAHPAGALSVVFAAAFLTQGWRLRQTIVWVKDAMVLGHADYHYRHEPILYGHKPGAARFGRGHSGWYGGNAETSVIEVPRPRASRDHPTAKPVELVRRMLENSSAPGQVVLDPFLGSGSTLIASEQLGRRLFGIEIDPMYVDVAVTRWEAFTGRTGILMKGATGP